MALDGVFLRLVKNELSPLIGGRVEKIHQPSREELVFGIRTKDGAYKLLLNSGAGTARVHVTKAEIEKIRGVSSEHAVSKLVEYNLVQELGRLDAPGRPLLFGTTEEFLRSFGVSSIDELPVLSPVQVEEFKQEAEEEMHVKLDV